MVNGEAAEKPSYCSDQARSAAVGVKRCWKMLRECIFENLEHELVGGRTYLDLSSKK